MRRGVRHLRKFLRSLRRVHAEKFCCMCQTAVSEFLPYRGGTADLPPLMQILQIVGSDVDNFSCPLCGANDRERHLYLYCMSLGVLNKAQGGTVLHFAPERRFTDIVEKMNPASYIKADLFPRDSATVQMDITEIDCKDETFDLVIVNHVLEHVPDDLVALQELRRVLKPGGIAILQTPYSNVLTKSFQDEGINTDELRFQIYGQEDHVRIYGKDIFQRFASAGLVSDVRFHHDALPDVNCERFGVNLQEPLFLFRKPDLSS